jgi:hypothetical protein
MPPISTTRISRASSFRPSNSTDSPSSRPPLLTSQDRNVRDACAAVPSVTSCDIPRRQISTMTLALSYV